MLFRKLFRGTPKPDHPINVRLEIDECWVTLKADQVDESLTTAQVHFLIRDCEAYFAEWVKTQKVELIWSPKRGVITDARW